jgi:hypothetical protein
MVIRHMSSLEPSGGKPAISAARYVCLGIRQVAH